jgi:cytochrome c-type biogenesis protein CcmH/NrfG
VIVIALLAYSNSFHVPFVLDDKPQIVENPEIRDIASFFDLEHLSTRRYIGQLSFALNYWVHGLDVVGYHVVNLVIHIINGLLVYLLVIYTFRAPRLEGSGIDGRAVAVFSSLLFVAHPVQTQAVTYIVQRYASMATMFYLGSVVFYVRWRLGGRVWWYVGAVVLAVLGMKTKEICFTLPVVVFLYEVIFFGRPERRRFLYLIPLFLTMVIIPLSLLKIDRPLGEVIGDVSKTTKIQTELSRWSYLCTEFRVIVTYLRLLFFPVNQNLDYDYPVFHGLNSPEIFFSFLLLLSLIVLAGYILFLSRSKESSLKIISFGIFWFFITLSVESSIIPIADVIFEHRLYLSSVGVFIAISILIFNIGRRFKVGSFRIGTFCLMLIILLTGLTYLRNRTWHDEVTLWTDVVKKSPTKARGYNNLAEAYINIGQVDKSYWYLQKALELYPDFPEAHINMGIYYTQKRMYNKAIQHLLRGLKYAPENWKGHMNIGFAYLLIGDIDRAIKHLEKAVKIFPYDAKLNLNLGIAYKAKGFFNKAKEHLDTARRLNPDLFRRIH